MRAIFIVSMLTTLGLWPRAAASQQPGQEVRPAADSALAACAAAAEGGRAAEAATAADRAERLLRDAVARQPATAPPRVAMARVLLQCRLPYLTSVVEQGAMFGEAVELLEAAVALDSTYWPARLVLGLAMARAPAMLGLTDNAIARLERFAGPGGAAVGNRELAEVLVALGDLYARRGRTADARRVWRRGRDAFPDDLRFLARLASLPQEATGVPVDSTPAAPAARIPVTLSDIVVTTTAPAADERRGGRAVTSLDIVTTPGGTADLLLALQALPGVTGGSESSDLVLRGGDPVETPVILNGARLAYASKFESLHGGLFSVLDPAVLRTARVMPGGFSVRFGDAMSGVIDVEAVGRPGGRSWRAGANSAGLSGTVMTPLGRRWGAWVTARGTHTGPLLALHGRSAEFASAPASLEGMAGATWLGSRAELRAVGLLESDDGARVVAAGGYRGAYQARGTTAGGSVSVRLGRLGPFATTQLAAALSQRVSRIRFGALDRSRRLRRADLDAHADWLPAAAVLIRSGIQIGQVEELADGRVPTAGSYDPAAPVRVLVRELRRAGHVGAFTEMQLTPAGALTLTMGVRADRLPGEDAWTADPRLAAAARAGEWTLSLGAGVFRQGRFRAGIDQPGSDARIGVARRARHLVAGLERRRGATIRLDAYLKRYDRWVDGDSAFRPDRGRVEGVDVFVAASGRRRNGWLTYGLARGRLELPDGSSAPTAFDVTHGLVAVGRQQLAPGWDLGVTLRLATGRPFTPIVGAVAGADSTAPLVPVSGPPNSDRYPAYGRLDARLSRYLALSGGLLSLYAEMLNLTGRANVVAYGYDESFTARQPVPHFFGQRTIVMGLEARF